MKIQDEYTWRKRKREDEKVKFPIIVYVVLCLMYRFKTTYPNYWSFHEPLWGNLMNGKTPADFPYKMILLAVIGIFWSLVIISFCKRMFGTGETQILDMLASIAAIFVLMEVQKYTFIKNSGKAHFWTAALVVSLIIVVIFSALMIAGIIKFRGFKISPSVLSIFAAVYVMTVMLTATFTHLNCILDTSQAEPHIYTVMSKTKQVIKIGGGRHSARYNRYILNGKADDRWRRLYVSSYYFEQYELYEEIQIYEYEGFFGDAYYLWGNKI